MKQYKVYVNWNVNNPDLPKEYIPFFYCDTPLEVEERIKDIRTAIEEKDQLITIEITETLTEKEFNEEMETRKLLENHLQAFIDFQKEIAKGGII